MMFFREIGKRYPIYERNNVAYFLIKLVFLWGLIGRDNTSGHNFNINFRCKICSGGFLYFSSTDNMFIINLLQLKGVKISFQTIPNSN